jgi:hypothetical protein
MQGGEQIEAALSVSQNVIPASLTAVAARVLEAMSLLQ